jgi:hypothetical protein
MTGNETSGFLYGLEAIGGFLGMTAKQAKHRALAGQIPTFKMGRSVCATKQALSAWLAEQEAAVRAPAPRS